MNQNQTESKPVTAEQPADEGLDETACSPSSLTPETDSVWEKHSGTNAELAIDAIRLCGKLERERDMARATANTFRQCAEVTFGTMPFPRKFHWENAGVLAHADEKTL